VNIGICKGKSLQLFTDTSEVVREVARHTASSGLKAKINHIDNEVMCIKAEEKKILVTTILNNRLLKDFNPDFVILYGKFPSVERSLGFIKPVRAIVVTGGVKSSFRIMDSQKGTNETVVHYIGKSGAFITRL
jgi:hypothetical protein